MRDECGRMGELYTATSMQPSCYMPEPYPGPEVRLRWVAFGLMLLAALRGWPHRLCALGEMHSTHACKMLRPPRGMGMQEIRSKGMLCCAYGSLGSSHAAPLPSPCSTSCSTSSLPGSHAMVNPSACGMQGFHGQAGCTYLQRCHMHIPPTCAASLPPCMPCHDGFLTSSFWSWSWPLTALWTSAAAAPTASSVPPAAGRLLLLLLLAVTLATCATSSATCAHHTACRTRTHAPLNVCAVVLNRPPTSLATQSCPQGPRSHAAHTSGAPAAHLGPRKPRRTHVRALCI